MNDTTLYQIDSNLGELKPIYRLNLDFPTDMKVAEMERFILEI